MGVEFRRDEAFRPSQTEKNTEGVRIQTRLEFGLLDFLIEVFVRVIVLYPPGQLVHGDAGNENRAYPVVDRSIRAPRTRNFDLFGPGSSIALQAVDIHFL